MLRILICDDEEAFARRLRGVLRSELPETKAAICAYGAMEEIPEEVLTGCDLAFLDIDFAGRLYTGLDIAARLRRLRPEAVIIFVTNYIEYAPRGYEVGAFRYLLKSELERKLGQYLQEALAQLESDRQVLTIRAEGEPVSIPLQQILYLEANQHTVLVHTTSRDYTTYATLAELEERLESKGFLRIHKSYLVNMAHLSKYQSQEAVLSDGTCLRVSARSYAAQKQKYLLWKGRL